MTSVVRDGRGFRLALDDGEELRAKQVVVAAGITHFASMPQIVDGLSPELVSHSSAHRDLSRLRRPAGDGGRRRGVGGQPGGLAGTSGRPEPARGAHALGPLLLAAVRRAPYRPRQAAQARLRPRARVALSRELRRARPLPLRAGPVATRDRAAAPRPELGVAPEGAVRVLGRGRHRTLAPARRGRPGRRPAGAGQRQGEPPITVESDHVICATGYRADVERLRFLDPSVRSELRTLAKAPVLSRRFESSVPGLYFLGLSAAVSFGPHDALHVRRRVRRPPDHPGPRPVCRLTAEELRPGSDATLFVFAGAGGETDELAPAGRRAHRRPAGRRPGARGGARRSRHDRDDGRRGGRRHPGRAAARAVPAARLLLRRAARPGVRTAAHRRPARP